MAEKNVYSSGFVVVLDKDVDEKSTKELLNAIKMIRGVIDVKPVIKDEHDDRMRKSRIIKEFKKVVLEYLDKQ